MKISNIRGITDLVFIEQNIQPSDVAIVLGNDWVKTMDTLLPYYKKGVVKKVIITGYSHQLYKEPEALRFEKRALEIGFRLGDLFLETKAKNTKENFLFSKIILEKEFKLDNVKKVLLVCQTFHTRRAFMTANKFLSDNMDYYFLPVLDDRNVTKDNWWTNKISKDLVLGELWRIGQYTLANDLKI
jgi:vancomycin permeability regulator SanA